MVLFALFGLLYTPLLLLFRRWFAARRLKRFLAKGPSADIFGPQEVVVTPEGVTVGKSTQVTTPWPTVVKVVETMNGLYIYLNPQSAAIIPKRGFPDETAFQDFVHAVREFHAQTSIPRTPRPPIAAP